MVEDNMYCPYKSRGFVDKCIGSCRPLETIFSYSGLTHDKAKCSSKNVLEAYTAVKLDDLVRDGNLVIKYFARKGRNRMSKILPERLNQFIITTNQKIVNAEKFNVDFEQYLYTIGKMGGQIFNLATPTGSSYDKDFVTEAGIVSAKLMVMDDMSKDLFIDIKSGKYNPLKDTQTHSKYNSLYVKTKNRLEGIMNKIGIERIVPTNSLANSSDGWWQCCLECLCSITLGIVLDPNVDIGCKILVGGVWAVILGSIALCIAYDKIAKRREQPKQLAHELEDVPVWKIRQLTELKERLDSGRITQEEYEQEKKLLEKDKV